MTDNVSLTTGSVSPGGCAELTAGWDLEVSATSLDCSFSQVVKLGVSSVVVMTDCVVLIVANRNFTCAMCSWRVVCNSTIQ